METPSFDTAVGYQFNRYLTVECGLPAYFVKPSSSTTAATGATAQSGIGNAYLDLRLTLLNRRKLHVFGDCRRAYG